MYDNKRICEINFKIIITCLLEKNCIPEIVNKGKGEYYIRSPKAKNDFTKYLKNKLPKYLCK